MPKNSFPDAGSPDDPNCARCRRGLDRAGRYCRRCLKSRQLKILFGSVVLLQLSAVGVMAMRGTRPSLFVPSDGSHVTIVAPADTNSRWVYYDVTDPLIQDVTHHAKLMASGLVGQPNAPAPAHAAEATLEVAFSHHYGTTILVTFPKVTTACGANVCQVTAMFDRRAPVTIGFHSVDDPRSTVLMLSDDAGFTASLRQAHDLTIVASLGTDQDSVLSFGVGGFRMRMAALRKPVRLGQIRGRTSPG